MSLRNYITASNGKKIYLETQQLQHVKVKFAIAKNQLIFLKRCIANNMPKSFRIKSPILSKKGNFYNLQEMKRKKECTKAIPK